MPVVLAAAVLLAGCSGLRPQWDPQPIDASQSVIRFEHAGFDPQRAQYTRHHDPISNNDVYIAQFPGNDAYAALAAYKTGPSFVVEERTVEAYVADLMRDDAELTWGKSGRVSTGLGHVPYRMFEIAGQPVSCVGFALPRGESSDDRGRKSDLVFGFFCQSDLRPISTVAATELIGSVSLAGRR